MWNVFLHSYCKRGIFRGNFKNLCFSHFCLLRENYLHVKIKPICHYEGNRSSIVKITPTRNTWNVLPTFSQNFPPGKITTFTVCWKEPAELLAKSTNFQKSLHANFYLPWLLAIIWTFFKKPDVTPVGRLLIITSKRPYGSHKTWIWQKVNYISLHCKHRENLQLTCTESQHLCKVCFKSMQLCGVVFKIEVIKWLKDKVIALKMHPGHFMAWAWKSRLSQKSKNIFTY